MLLAQAALQAGPAGPPLAEAKAYLDIRAEDGQELPFDLRCGTLLVDLGRSACKGDTVKLRFEIEGPLLPDESDGRYQKAYAWTTPSTSQDVPDLLKAVTGRDYTKWMDDNFWGTGMPAWQPGKTK